MVQRCDTSVEQRLRMSAMNDGDARWYVPPSPTSDIVNKRDSECREGV